jgi:hypothetical protein
MWAVIVAIFVSVFGGAWIVWIYIVDTAERGLPIRIDGKYYILKEVVYNPKTEEFNEGEDRSDTDTTI